MNSYTSQGEKWIWINVTKNCQVVLACFGKKAVKSFSLLFCYWVLEEHLLEFTLGMVTLQRSLLENAGVLLPCHESEYYLLSAFYLQARMVIPTLALQQPLLLLRFWSEILHLMLKQLHWSVLIIPLAHCGVKKKQSAQICTYSFPSLGQPLFNDMEFAYLLFQLGNGERSCTSRRKSCLCPKVQEYWTWKLQWPQLLIRSRVLSWDGE